MRWNTKPNIETHSYIENIKTQTCWFCKIFVPKCKDLVVKHSLNLSHSRCVLSPMSVSEGNLDVSKNEEGKADVGKKAGRGKFSPIGDRLISIPLLLACNCNCNL